MGMCLPCLGSSSNDYTTPDPVSNSTAEDRRKQHAEAAERRIKEQEGKGIKDPERLKSLQRKRDESERRVDQNVGSGGGGLRWQVG